MKEIADRGGAAMTVIPPGGLFQDPKAFEPEEVREVEELSEKGIPVHRDEHHEHGDDCGHEAIEHGDHTDYIHDGRRHFFHLGRWHEHKE
jgi:hypothetical protein